MRRLPIYILIDSSASMRGEPIEAVKDGIQRLLSSLRRDPYALESVWLSVITFDRNAHVLIPLTELSEFHCPDITLSNNTERNLGLGLQLLLIRCQKEIKRTTTDEKGDWLPIAVTMTSGDPSDTARFETIIPLRKTFSFAKIIVCVTGTKNKLSILNRITKDIFSLDTMDS
ncbi:MAG: VWA domain-containing protein, partial [Planctomycetaceae bacterium]|nr:VWA domain-containing protein [Planctomycetaceae bacterium]